jgi:acetyl-CoA acetyltransferase
MTRKVEVAGVGMIPFVKPGTSGTYAQMGQQAAMLALDDAGIDYGLVQQAYAGFVYGDSTSGQAALYPIGMSGIPIVNVNNNCSTGSTALFLARQAVAAGAVDCALAVGFEQMIPGSLSDVYQDRPSPLSRFLSIADEFDPDLRDLPMALRLWGGAGREYQQRHGMKTETFAKVAEKARRHAAQNERAVFRAPITVDEVMTSKLIYGPLTRLQCCPPTCGAAAAVLVSDDFARRRGLEPGVSIRAQAMTTDTPATFERSSLLSAVGFDLGRAAADKAFAEGAVEPGDIDVVELHDCFTVNEVIAYEALRLTPEGTSEQFIQDGENTYGGRIVTNPSGGLLSKGHPLGATGLAQCAELVWQLRGASGTRQVEGARLALQHNLGLGGACVVTLYEGS